MSTAARIAGDRPVPHIVTELPGPKARAHVAFDETWTSPSLPRAYPLVPVRGEGSTIEDIDGNLFLDFAAGIAVNSTGHAHPQVVAAIKEQAAELLHFSASDFYLPIYAEVCRRLAGIAPIDGPARVYLGNSGAEAVEASIKLARFATKRPYVVAFLGAFHGRTYGAVSLTASKAKYHAGFGPLLPGVFHAPFGHVEDLRWFDEVLFDKLAPAGEVAGVIVEPIQGEGGYIVPENEFLQGLRRLARPRDGKEHSVSEIDGETTRHHDEQTFEMAAKLNITYSAYRELETIPQSPLRHIGEAIIGLAEDPRPPG